MNIRFHTNSTSLLTPCVVFVLTHSVEIDIVYWISTQSIKLLVPGEAVCYEAPVNNNRFDIPILLTTVS